MRGPFPVISLSKSGSEDTFQCFPLCATQLNKLRALTSPGHLDKCKMDQSTRESLMPCFLGDSWDSGNKGFTTDKQIPTGRVQHFVPLNICFLLSCKAQGAGGMTKSRASPTFCQRSNLLSAHRELCRVKALVMAGPGSPQKSITVIRMGKLKFFKLKVKNN